MVLARNMIERIPFVKGKTVEVQDETSLDGASG